MSLFKSVNAIFTSLSGAIKNVVNDVKERKITDKSKPKNFFGGYEKPIGDTFENPKIISDDNPIMINPPNDDAGGQDSKDVISNSSVNANLNSSLNSEPKIINSNGSYIDIKNSKIVSDPKEEKSDLPKPSEIDLPPFESDLPGGTIEINPGGGFQPGMPYPHVSDIVVPGLSEHEPGDGYERHKLENNFDNFTIDYDKKINVEPAPYSIEKIDETLE